MRARDVRCVPIKVQYTSLDRTFSFKETPSGERDPLLEQPFWLGRPRFLRDAPPVTYEHAADSAMQSRGSLGHVIGVVEYGECVKALARRYAAGR